MAPFSQLKDDLQTVVVPISAEVAIFGQKGKQRPIELKTINRLLAGCSYDAFIAKRDDPNLASLYGRIGKYANLMSDHVIRELLSFERLLPDWAKRKMVWVNWPTASFSRSCQRQTYH